MAFIPSAYLTTLSLRICVIVITGNLYKQTLTEAIEYETVVVRLGSNVTLPCENIGNSTEDGKLWIFNNISLLYAGYLRYAPANLANVNLDANGSLLIQNVERKNEASYVCRSGSKEILNQYVVIIEVLPTLSMKFLGEVSYGSDECQISNQQSYQIECNATGSSHNVSISWAINNTTYNGRERVMSITGDNNTIHTESVILYRPSFDDREISCRATGQTSSYVMEQLTISVCDEKPQKSLSLFANYGETVDMFCEASGAMAMWEFPIRDNIKTLHEGELLHIDNVTIENEGEYKCFKTGEATVITYFTVQVLPTLSMKFLGEVSYGSDECQISNQQSYQIECNATGSSHNVSISWAINNTTYNGRERVMSITGDNNTIHTESVILYRPSFDDREISCRATGQTSSYVMEQLTISVCDEKPQKSLSLFANYGETVDMFCEASGAMAMWEFPIRDNIKTLHEGELLHIDNVTIENEGEYKCFKTGEATVITYFTVQVIPKLTISFGGVEGSFENITVYTHKLYKVHCIYSETRPPARISWKINNNDYDIGLKTLNRSRETKSDTMDYHSTILYIPSIGDKNISCSVRDGNSGMQWTTSMFIETFERTPELSYNISVPYGNNVSFCCDYEQNDDFLWDFNKKYDYVLASTFLEGVTELEKTWLNGTKSSCLYFEDAKKTHEGRYACYKFNRSMEMFVLGVKVTPRVEIIFEDNPDLNKVVVYRSKPYLVQCLVSGAYPPFTMLWKVNGITTVDGVYNGNKSRNVNAADLFDSTSRLEYKPNEDDRSITCLVNNGDGSFTETKGHIKDVITVDAELEAKRILHGSNVNLRCNYSDGMEILHWSFNRTRISCVERKCNHSNIFLITSTRNETMISITNFNGKNEGRYSCYHGLEEIKIIHVTMEVKLGVYLLPGMERIYPYTVEFYEGSQYMLVCIANSTDDIRSLQWQVNGAYVSGDVATTTVNRSLTLRQVTSRYLYTPVISHLTISCIAEGEDGTIVTQLVKIHLVLSFRKKLLLSGGVSLFLLVLAAILVLLCRCCCQCTKKKKVEVDKSIELRERSNELQNVDTAAWRRAMNAFAERSSTRYGLLRRSRMLSETSSSGFEETGDIYNRFIVRSFGSSFLPFSRLSFVVKLKSGAFKDNWVGKLRERTIVKTGTFISAVSGNVSEDKKYRWDMFVKNVIEIPFSRHIARIIGISMQNERLYLLQEFLTVENLKTYLKTNTRLLTSDRQVSKTVLRIARGVVDGMFFLTNNKFCHPALSINKILIENCEECKLYDFCLLEDAPDKIESIQFKRKLNFANLAKETILQGEYTVLSDVWSIGIALWEIFSLGDEPFNGSNQEDIRRLIQRGHQLPPPASCSRQFYHVMLDCWVESTERPTLSTIREKLETTIQEYIPIGDASRRDETGPSASTGDTYGSVRSTYGFTDYSHRRREENIYEQMEGSCETISESMQ